MEITCQQCQRKLIISDEKIPVGKVSSLHCPKCRSKITIDLRPANTGDKSAAGPAAARGGGIDFSGSPGAGENYDASEKPFDFLEEEGKTALLCESDPERLKLIKEPLEVMEYHITEPGSIREALRQMKYHVFDLVLLNERFENSDPDANGLLIYLERMAMDVRRDIFVALISERCPTMDYMTAFLRSVNLMINPKDLASLDRILTRGINERDMIYDVYKESARKFGKI